MADKFSDKCEEARRAYHDLMLLMDPPFTAEKRAEIEQAKNRVRKACGDEKKSIKVGDLVILVDPFVREDDASLQKIIEKAKQVLPPGHIHGLSAILITGLVRKEGSQVVEAAYDPAAKTLTMYLSGYTLMTFKHEIGHHVWNTLLAPAAQERWRTAFAKPAFKGKLPSERAKVDALEAWAEAYAWYYDKVEGKTLDPDVESAFKQVLGIP